MGVDQPPPMSRPRVAAGALFFDEAGDVLLVKPNYKEGWDIPGGYVEPGETPTEACRREVHEELGLDRDVGRLLVVDWAPSETEGDKILFVFDGGELSTKQRDQLTLQRAELDAVASHSANTFDDLMPTRLARRLTAAVAARHSATWQYLEHGTER